MGQVIGQVIGMMSGTSLDGVDAAWLETDGKSVTAFGPSLTLPYDDSLRDDLRKLLDLAPELPVNSPFLLDLEKRLTLRHAEAVKALGRPAALIGFHGQTILHRPSHRQTWQIGDAGLLARLTGLPVAFDFRSADVAAGGQGAPLVPVFHAALAGALPKPIAVLNIGGVANLTFIGPDGTLLACDTGPGNGPLDDWMRHHTGQPMDQGGALALAGTPDEHWLQDILSEPFFTRPGPKSLDRLEFNRQLQGMAGLTPADGAATLAALVARAVAACPLPTPPRAWLVCGGGRHNAAIMAALRHALAAPVDPVETVGWDGDALEAQCFGFLAMRCRRGLPLSFPGTTAVPRPMPGGQLAYP